MSNKNKKIIKRLKKQNRQLRKSVRSASKPRKATRRVRTKTTRIIPSAYTTPLRNVGACNSIRVKHREFIMDIVAPSDPYTIQLPVNPGMEETFPWLSMLAAGFETYKFHSLCFKYIPAVSTGTAGTVSIIPDYDSADTIESHKQKLLAHQDSVIGPAYQNLIMRSRTKNLHKSKEFYMRYGELMANKDIKMYDVAKLIIYVQTAHTDTLGSLWVEYDVSLITPQLQSPEVVETAYGVNDGPGDETKPFYDSSVPGTGLMNISTTIAATVINFTRVDISEVGRFIVWLFAKDTTSASFTNIAATYWYNLKSAAISLADNYSSEYGNIIDLVETDGNLTTPSYFTWTGMYGSAIDQFKMLITAVDMKVFSALTAKKHTVRSILNNVNTPKLEKPLKVTKQPVKTKEELTGEEKHKVDNKKYAESMKPFLKWTGIKNQIINKTKVYDMHELWEMEQEAFNCAKTIKQHIQILQTSNWLRDNGYPEFVGLHEELQLRVTEYINSKL